MNLYKIILYGFFLLAVSKLHAQTQESDQKIGLVLSGGGAKGLAHIGVLKVIDSLGIKVDYIGGTSMGAVIGGLYASGYNGKQLDSIFRTLDFDNLINDFTPRGIKPYYTKINDDKYVAELPFDNFKLKLPKSISKGQNVFNLLTRLTHHVSSIQDFDSLPIPFLCIGTDVETGEPYVFENGSLARAITASAALPSLFKPIEINGKLYTDGGVVNNYPIHEVKNKGVDIIIGVNVQYDLASKDELDSLGDLMLQINNYRSNLEMRSKKRLADIYIKPNINEFSVLSFNDGLSIINAGELAAKAALGLNDLSQNNISSEDIKIKVNDSIFIDNVIVKGNQKYSLNYVLGKLKFKENTAVSFEDLDKGIDVLMSTNNFDYFDYDLVKNEDQKGYDLVGNLIESPSSSSMKFSVHHDDLYKSALLVNYTKKRLLFGNDVTFFDFIIGDNLRYNFEYYLDRGFSWSFGLHSSFNAFHKSFNTRVGEYLTDDSTRFSSLNKINAGFQDLTNQFYIQTIFKRAFLLAVGVEHKYYRIDTETILDINGKPYLFENSHYLSGWGQLEIDTYDDKYFPNKGLILKGDFHWYLSSSGFNESFKPFSIAKAKLGYAFSFLDHCSLNLKTEGGFKIGSKSTKTLDFAIGGYGNDFMNNISSFYGYDFLSLVGDSYVKAEFDFDYEIFSKSHLLLNANFSNIGSGIFEKGKWFSLPDYTGFAAGYGLETFFGPMQIKYSWSPDHSDDFWFFSLGFWF